MLDFSGNWRPTPSLLSSKCESGIKMFADILGSRKFTSCVPFLKKLLPQIGAEIQGTGIIDGRETRDSPGP